MTNLVRIRSHPSDPVALILDIPYELNSELRKFGPAILAPELKGFVLLEEHLDSFRRFARTIDAHVIDERQHAPGPKPLMPECETCGQPASLMNQPKRCPACGNPWRPVFIDGRASHEAATKTCLRCNHTQLRHWPYCAECGTPMPPDEPQPERPAMPPLPRTKLVDPMPLAEMLPEVRDELSRQLAREAIDAVCRPERPTEPTEQPEESQ